MGSTEDFQGVSYQTEAKSVELFKGAGVYVSLDSANRIQMKVKRRVSLLVRETVRGLWSEAELSTHCALGRRQSLEGARPRLDQGRVAALKGNDTLYITPLDINLNGII